jgi:sigma-E factor negative regulatory protein RseA
MSDGVDHGDRRQALSALADGELDAGAVQRACAAWREDPDARTTWHAYHLIGDVLRSDDLCAHAGHDEQFLARLRRRLADEPVVLAPEPLPVAQPAAVQVGNGTSAVRRRAWAAPIAMAASFVAVTGLVVATRMGPAAGIARGDTLAAATPQIATLAAEQVAASASFAADDLQSGDANDGVATDAKLVRDPALDRYLAAHRQYGYALSVPGVTLRNAAAFEPGR